MHSTISSRARQPCRTVCSLYQQQTCKSPLSAMSTFFSTLHQSTRTQSTPLAKRAFVTSSTKGPPSAPPKQYLSWTSSSPPSSSSSVYSLSLPWLCRSSIKLGRHFPLDRNGNSFRRHFNSLSLTRPPLPWSHGHTQTRNQPLSTLVKNWTSPKSKSPTSQQQPIQAFQTWRRPFQYPSLESRHLATIPSKSNLQAAPTGDPSIRLQRSLAAVPHHTIKNEIKLRCTEFDHKGNVKTTAGEFLKSDLCQQVLWKRFVVACAASRFEVLKCCPFLCFLLKMTYPKNSTVFMPEICARSIAVSTTRCQ